MSGEIKSNDFIAYEYRDISIDKDFEAIYIDYYPNFGWILDSIVPPQIGKSNGTIKFKRDRKILNKTELTRLQRQFDSCISEIKHMEDSKQSKALIAALSAGFIGTVFMAGATFSYLGQHIILWLVLAVPGFIGWILPYFLHKTTYSKRAMVVAPLIESKYDELYEVCERANILVSNR